MSAARSADSGPAVFRMDERGRPSMNSMTMKYAPASSPQSKTGTMLGWDRLGAACASRRKRSTKVLSTGSSGKRTFSATGRLRSRSWARYTSAMPPRAIRWFSSYRSEKTRGAWVGSMWVKAYAYDRYSLGFSWWAYCLSLVTQYVLEDLLDDRARNTGTRLFGRLLRDHHRHRHFGLAIGCEGDQPVSGLREIGPDLGSSGLGRHIPVGWEDSCRGTAGCDPLHKCGEGGCCLARRRPHPRLGGVGSHQVPLRAADLGHHVDRKSVV